VGRKLVLKSLSAKIIIAGVLLKVFTTVILSVLDTRKHRANWLDELPIAVRTPEKYQAQLFQSSTEMQLHYWVKKILQTFLDDNSWAADKKLEPIQKTGKKSHAGGGESNCSPPIAIYFKITAEYTEQLNK
jgi:hypothetical protein